MCGPQDLNVFSLGTRRNTSWPSLVTLLQMHLWTVSSIKLPCIYTITPEHSVDCVTWFHSHAKGIHRDSVYLKRTGAFSRLFQVQNNPYFT
jgi:hypothetical protein